LNTQNALSSTAQSSQVTLTIPQQLETHSTIPDYALCPITQEIMRHPVILSETGNSYDEEAILKWFSHKNTDPLTNTTLRDHIVIPNHGLRAAISHALSNNMVDVTVTAFDKNRVQSVFKVMIYRFFTIKDLKTSIHKEQGFRVQSQFIFRDDLSLEKEWLFLTQLHNDVVVDSIIRNTNISKLEIKLYDCSYCYMIDADEILVLKNPHYKGQPKQLFILPYQSADYNGQLLVANGSIIGDGGVIAHTDYKNLRTIMLDEVITLYYNLDGVPGVIAAVKGETMESVKNKIATKEGFLADTLLAMYVDSGASTCSGEKLFELVDDEKCVVHYYESILQIRLTIDIKYTINSKPGQLHAEKSETIESVKCRIAIKECITLDMSVIWLKSGSPSKAITEIDTGSQVSSHKSLILPGSSLIIQLRDNTENIKIFVKSLTGRIITLNCYATELIVQLKWDIQGKEGIPVEQQRLIYTGKRLEDDRSISDYNIQNESTIHFVLNLSGC
jgi:hypothetical protein